MDWWFTLAVIFGVLLLLFATGLPVAFAFLIIILVGVYIYWGGEAGLVQLPASLYKATASFTLVPVPLFLLMGEVMFRSGVAPGMFRALDKWIGRLPGRLSLMAVASGTLFSTMTGSSMGSTGLLGALLVPQMEKHGYKRIMALGPIMGSGGLAMMIPPSNLAVILAGIAQISVGKVLIGGILPGLLMAFFYSIYIIGRCHLQPHLAPPYEVAPTPISEKIVVSVKHILPLTFIIFMVIGLIFLGVATPTESAATGVVGAFVLAAAYKGLNWDMLKKSFLGTLNITVMTFMIIVGAQAFSQIMVFSKTSAGLSQWVARLPFAPIFLVIGMQLVLLFLGCFMGAVAIMMITVPIFFPIIEGLGLNPIWFASLMLLNIEMGMLTPPFGMLLFVMKGVAPPGTTMGDVIRSGMPFLYVDLAVLGLMVAFPSMVVWLPNMMKG